jgi:chaperonin cofactor prefoldin
MTEVIAKAITDALIDLKLDNTLERLDKRLSTLTDRVAALEVQPPPDQEVHDGRSTS